MTIKVGHISDVHIRNLKYHDVYRKVFENLYIDLKERGVDYIVLTGDIAHTKTQISPEYVSMASSFFENLAAIAPTIIIPGNHDGNLRNKTRMDAISPIVNSLNNPNLFFLKDSGIIPFEGIDFYHLSVFDKDNWPPPKKGDSISVALYHGAVSGVKTDIGFVITDGDAEKSDFKGFDYGMFGDIHKTNQWVTNDGKFRYPGSLITQNFGETNDKGYLLWSLEDKENFKVKHIMLDNPKPFVSVRLTPDGKLPHDTLIPDNARVRLVATQPISLDKMRKAVDIVKERFTIESVAFLNHAGTSDDQSRDSSGITKGKNIRDIKIQEELIKAYLEEYKVEDALLKKIFELNKNINAVVEGEEQSARNVNWKIKNVSWDNLFNYGDGNVVDFDKLSGIIGIFGKSYSGKSSVIDSILYAMFNSTSKRVTKNYDMINQHKPKASASVELQIDNKIYNISRESEKYFKKLKGVETEEAKTTVDIKWRDTITGEEGLLTDNSRSETDRKIRNLFGTLEDFMVTSLSAQFGSLAFIDQRSTDRKKTLGKFLDLDFFEEKYKLANENSSDLKGALKFMESKDIEESLKEMNEELIEVEAAFDRTSKEYGSISTELKAEEKLLNDLELEINSIPKEIGKVVKKATLEDKEDSILLVREKIKMNKKAISSDEEALERLMVEWHSINLEEIEHRLEESQKLAMEALSLTNNVEHNNEVIRKLKKAKENIKNAPCNDDYSNCSLVKEAHDILSGLDKINNYQENISTLENHIKEIEAKIQGLNPDSLKKEKERFENLRNLVSNKKAQTSKLYIDMYENEKKLKALEEEHETLKEKYQEYLKNKELFDAKDRLDLSREAQQIKCTQLRSNFKSLGSQIVDLNGKKGYCEKKIEFLEKDKKELDVLREEYAAYDLYKKCMHANGIPFGIIKEKLPHINNEISKVLSDIVDFEVFFQSDDKKLEIYIKHAKHEARPIETGSGAEKTLAATAIRLALLTVSSLPKGDIFILDEPATELDEDSKRGFVKILDMIKVFFKNVILISHLESLKDVVDSQIEIDKKDGYAFVDMS